MDLDAFSQLVVFTLEEQRYALRLTAVERIVPVAQITALPRAPDIVHGVVNFQGRVIAVVDVRRRFGLPPRELELSDHLIVAHSSRRVLALLVEGVEGVIDCLPMQVVSGDTIVANNEYVHGVLKLEEGLILIHDLDSFLSPMEDRTLAEALLPA